MTSKPLDLGEWRDLQRMITADTKISGDVALRMLATINECDATITQLSAQLDECQLRGAALVVEGDQIAKERDHWHRARQSAIEAGDMMHTELTQMRADLASVIGNMHDLVSAQNERISSLEMRREEIERETAERIAAYVNAKLGYPMVANMIEAGFWRIG